MRLLVVVSLALVTGCPGGSSGGADGGTGKRVFVTSNIYSGDLGGLDGADQKCNTAAQASELGGTWKAFLSTSSVNAPDRMADVGPWYRVDGEKAFNNRANLSTSPAVGINVTETGDRLTESSAAWTGTAMGGTASGKDCQGWTSTNGFDNGTEGGVTSLNGWSQETSIGSPCGTSHNLYCFEQ